jgi:hypothetical protein
LILNDEVELKVPSTFAADRTTQHEWPTSFKTKERRRRESRGRGSDMKLGNTGKRNGKRMSKEEEKNVTDKAERKRDQIN